MKILHVIETLQSGGKERQLLELVRGLIKAGHDPQILVQADAIEYEITDIADRVHVLARRSRWDLGLIGRTRRFVTQQRPDVIHSWGTMCSVYCVPVSGFGKIPFVAGHIRDAPSRLNWLDKRLVHGRISEPFAAAVVANSQAGLAAYGVRSQRAHYIYNGFDFAGRMAAPDPAILAELGITTRHVVAMVARFGSHKDHATFFAAADQLLAERADVSFIAIGHGPGLEDWRARYAGEPRVKLLGRRADVERIIANISIGVLLTKVGHHGEGISNALTEMLAASKPVIATDDGGNRELVGNHACGILVPSDDAAAVVVAITSLLADPACAIALGAAGREAVMTYFTCDAMVAAYLDLYANIRRDAD